MPPFSKNLLSWYDRCKRDLPWRHTTNPYFIWISEAMLQQTTVATVIPYYERFIQTLPTLKDLATAPEDQLLKLWAGLGYYSRVRNLKKAAQKVVGEFNGKLPSTAAQLKTLPGLGDYASAAVASIAFGEVIPVVDGNVLRVVARYKGIGDDIMLPKTREMVRDIMKELIDKKRPGDFNQAVMELGATVCTPKNTQCLLCPLRDGCTAYKSNQVHLLPIKVKKTKYMDVNLTCFVYQHKKSYWLTQRAQGEVNGMMWEFPLEESRPQRTDIKPVKHAIMNKRITVWPVIEKMSQKPKQAGSWIAITQLQEYPLTTITKKVLKSIQSVQF
ncbi:A/G-specific adenine glycosylase [bacterium]|nr:A/G-specific adenine glycosylase [bacterium]